MALIYPFILFFFSEYDVLFEDGVSVLRFNKVIPEDEGEYVCEAFNENGRTSTKCFVKVQGWLIFLNQFFHSICCNFNHLFIFILEYYLQDVFIHHFLNTGKWFLSRIFHHFLMVEDSRRDLPPKSRFFLSKSSHFLSKIEFNPHLSLIFITILAKITISHIFIFLSSLNLNLSYINLLSIHLHF